MKTRLLIGLVCIACAALTVAQETKPAAAAREQYQKILDEYEAAQQEFSKIYQAAKTEQEQQKAFEKYPKPEKYALRFLEFAEKNPHDPKAVDALVWVVQRAQDGDAASKALKILRHDHIQSSKIGGVCQTLIYSRTQDAQKFLREILEKNSNHDVQGWAKFSLGKTLTSQRRGGQLPKEAEDLFEDVAQNFSDVKGYRGTLADLAPDIEGEDADGKAFKLSDYRGKVVVIDFWGDW
jgi:tetratricopeptide (TPR) repeat protein